MRGTFANVRIKNLMLPAREDGSREEGGYTLFQPGGEKMAIYDAAMKYMAAGVPTVIFAGQLIARVGLATNKPAEFIILRISQDTRALEAELAAAGV